MNHPRQFFRASTHAPASADARSRGASSPALSGWKRAVGAVAVGAIAVAVAIGAGAAPAQTGGRNAPLVPPTNDATSPFAADPGSSLPVGLTPNQTVNPLMAPGQPVVLSWDSVPGAVSYNVEVSSSPGFTKIVWSQNTDQAQVAPSLILADGTYWWRVTAIDKAGTHGITSSVATFAKVWDGTVTGGVLSDTPGGAAASLIRVTPYLTWNAVPGAAYYQVQIALADQFGSPSYDSGLITQTGIAPGDCGRPARCGLRVADPGVRRRRQSRAVDGGVEFKKAWIAPTPTLPTDGATVSSFDLRWNPVPGASSYEVQATRQEYNSRRPRWS